MVWKKLNDISWKHSSGALVQVVPVKVDRLDLNKGVKVSVRAYDVYVEARNKPRHRRVRIPSIKSKSIALKNAIKWMKLHPKG